MTDDSIVEDYMKRCRNVCLMLFLVLGSVLLVGCNKLDDVKETTISVGKKGAVTEVIMESAEGESYGVEELQSFVDADIKAFNQNAKTQNVELTSCEIKDGMTRIEIAYTSYTDYADYHKTRCFVGTVKEAENAGYDFNAEFQDNNGESAAASTILANDDAWHVVILEEPVQVLVEGTLLYTSTNAEITGKGKAKIAAEDGTGQSITISSPVYLIYK